MATYGLVVVIPAAVVFEPVEQAAEADPILNGNPCASEAGSFCSKGHRCHIHGLDTSNAHARISSADSVKRTYVYVSSFLSI